MKTVKIILDRPEILAEVKQNSAYAAARCPSESEEETIRRFPRVAAADTDIPLLARYWEEAASAMTDRLKDYLRDASLKNGQLILELEVSGAFDESLLPGLQSSLGSYMAAGMTGRWFRITFPDRAEEYDQEASRLLTDAERRLCHRRAPRRQKPSSLNNR